MILRSFQKTDLSKKLILKEDKVNIELGESFSKNIEDYVDDTFMNTHDISKIKLDTSDVEMMKEKDYPKAGSYDLKFMYDDQEVVCRLFVEDTVKPKFVKTVDSIEVIQGNELEEKEVLKNFEATDLDEVTLEFNDFNVNYDKPDTYTAKVYAEDTSNNMQSIEVQIVVKKDPSIKEITKKEAYKIAYNSNHYKKLLEKYPEDADKRIMFFEPVEMEREGMKGFDIEVRIDNPAAGEGVTNYVIGYFVTLDGTLYYEDRLKQDKLFETD